MVVVVGLVLAAMSTGAVFVVAWQNAVAVRRAARVIALAVASRSVVVGMTGAQ